MVSTSISKLFRRPAKDISPSPPSESPLAAARKPCAPHAWEDTHFWGDASVASPTLGPASRTSSAASSARTSSAASIRRPGMTSLSTSAPDSSAQPSRSRRPSFSSLFSSDCSESSLTSSTSETKEKKEVLRVGEACRKLMEVNETIKSLKAEAPSGGSVDNKWKTIQEIVSLRQQVLRIYVVNKGDRALVEPLQDRVIRELVAFEDDLRCQK
eukprot:CAMPEP_0181326432 /NCGR_PEP_ID=MMETSP1101-20121128/21494_1 /TAXON_ID=46948 /ORGANISM="Rhodomonas abbreviata, Strain Caron Lab Isolate" /LENGTH=212 /DNA_ID=CAMNT_0023434883 /DNA_START=37 /DNA_END=675 /DNA_ORIENTATION=+